MNSTDFEACLEAMQEISVETLKQKAAEYATGGDRLHNFRVAAKLQGISEKQALAGMMSKHTVSIYDMLYADARTGQFPLSLWEEKIKDHINYLFLLWAMVCEEQKPKIEQ